MATLPGGEVMMTVKNKASLLHRIGSNRDKFSAKQLKLAQYIEKYYTALTFATMTELSRQAGVSEATVVRFVYQLGYGGFAEFMTALRACAAQNNIPAAISRYDLKPKGYHFPQDTAKAIFTVELQVMAETLAMLNRDDLQKAIDLIYSAPTVLSIGCGPNTCCSQALGFALQAIRPGVHIIEQAGFSEGSLIRALPDGSACVVFTTPRYSTETQKVLETLRDKDVHIIGVSDSILSPLAPFSEIFFQIPVKYVTFIDTNAAFMALIHSIVLGLQMKDKKAAKKNIDGYNTFTVKQNFYVNDFLELVEF